MAIKGNVALGEHEGKGNGEIEGGAVFANGGGSEVDGNPFAAGKSEVHVFHGGLNAKSALADGVVGESDKVKGGEARADIDFDVDLKGVDAKDGTGMNFCEHNHLLEMVVRCEGWARSGWTHLLSGRGRRLCEILMGTEGRAVAFGEASGKEQLTFQVGGIS